MRKNSRDGLARLSIIGAVAFVLTVAPVFVSLVSTDGFVAVKVAHADQPQSGQPGTTEGQPGGDGPAPGQRGGGGQNHNNGQN